MVDQRKNGKLKMSKLDRFEFALRSERDYWEKNWKGNRDRQASASHYWQYYMNILKAHANPKPHHKILDIGCGPCGLICYLNEGQRYGLDPLMDFYLTNFDMPQEIKWIRGYGEDIPVEDSFFDIVITTNTLDHTQNPRKLLSEVNRVLKEDGLLFLSVNTYSQGAKLAKVFLERIGRGEPTHPYFFTTTEVRHLIIESGFNVFSRLNGVGDLGVTTSRETSMKASAFIVRIKACFHEAIEIWRKENYKSFLKALIRFGFVLIFEARQYPRDFMFIAAKKRHEKDGFSVGN